MAEQPRDLLDRRAGLPTELRGGVSKYVWRDEPEPRVASMSGQMRMERRLGQRERRHRLIVDGS
jgi:hypothetical protein